MNEENTISGKKNVGWTIFFHVAGWLLFICLPVLFGFQNNNFNWHGLQRFFTHLPLLVFFFYLNYFILVPRLYTTGKYGWFALFVVLSLVLMGCLYELADLLVKIDMPEHVNRHPRGPRPYRYISFFGVFNGLIALAVSTSVRITNELVKNEKQRKELENQTLKSELSFLKSQVNPHFLFNTLNNIYSLSLSRSEKAPEAIMKLSQLLRYMLYETDDKNVSLEKEIAHIEDYISLQRMRLTDQVEVILEKKGSLSGKHIEPLLLIPFVENAFKHGIHTQFPSFIKINITVEGEFLIFKVTNSIVPNSAEYPKDKNSGIGLSNVEKRLNLLYPDRYALDTNVTEKEYAVSLKINLV
jgi:two-component system LytT family sensor kinase